MDIGIVDLHAAITVAPAIRFAGEYNYYYSSYWPDQRDVILLLSYDCDIRIT